MPDFFGDWRLSGGQCASYHVEDYRLGYPLPPFEPAEDGYGTEKVVERLRAVIGCFDSVGMTDPTGQEILLSNLYLLADLANAAAGHVRRVVDAELAELSEDERRATEWAIQGLRDMARGLAAA